MFCVCNNEEFGTLLLRPTFSEMDLVPKEALEHSLVAVAWDENLEQVSRRPNCMLNFPKHELMNLAGTQAWEDFQGWFTSWEGKIHPDILR